MALKLYQTNQKRKSVTCWRLEILRILEILTAVLEVELATPFPTVVVRVSDSALTDS